MIGTSDGEQFNTQFEHAIASTMPPIASEKPAGELDTPTRYLPSQFPTAPNPNQFEQPKGSIVPGGAQLMHYQGKIPPDPEKLHQDQKSFMDRLRAVQPRPNESDVNSSPHPLSQQPEDGLGGWIDPDSFLAKKGIEMPKSDLGFTKGDHQGDKLDTTPENPRRPTEFNQNNAGHEIQANLSPNVSKILSQPHIAEAIANPKIDRSHDVPYVAGASAKPADFTTHVDRHIPTSVTIDGKTFDPAVPLNIHEQVEREVMNKLIKEGYNDNRAYEIAHHEYAEPAEDAWYRHHGIDVNEVNKWWSRQNKITEKEKGPDLKIPPDLYKKPYPHDEVEGSKHTPSNVDAEWMTKTPA